MAHTRKKSHNVRNFLLFVIICTLVVLSGQKIIMGLFPFSYTEYIDRYAAEYHLDRHLVMGVVKAESNFDKDAVSGSGAKGLMQLTDATALECAEKLGIEGYSGEDIFNPETNIRLGCFYLSYLLERFDGETETALAAYNAGEGNVRSWLSDPAYSTDGKTLYTIPYPETKSYNKKIRLYKNIYEIFSGWLES